MTHARTPYLCLILATLVAGCETSASRILSALGGETRYGKYDVKWDAIPALQNRVPDGLTPLIFIFSSTDPADSNGVTQADWERRAAQSGMTVSDLKNVVFGGEVYKGPDGELRVCTIAAIQKGLCGKKLGLSVGQRAKMAETILGQSTACRWVRFDPAYHRAAATNLGAQDFTLHVAADCSAR